MDLAGTSGNNSDMAIGNASMQVKNLILLLISLKAQMLTMFLLGSMAYQWKLKNKLV